ncbi:hypothetical protein O9993_09495 [Vibrio lentus]|nr:hypothetical protein [Vibrio lentus]
MSRSRDKRLIATGAGFRKITDCDTILPLGSVLNKQGEMFQGFLLSTWLKEVQAKASFAATLSAIHKDRHKQDQRKQFI